MAGGKLRALCEQCVCIREHQLAHAAAAFCFLSENRSRKSQRFAFGEYERLAGRMLCAHQDLCADYSFAADEANFDSGFGFD
jgi:hypothetical protein